MRRAFLAAAACLLLVHANIDRVGDHRSEWWRSRASIHAKSRGCCTAQGECADGSMPRMPTVSDSGLAVELERLRRHPRPATPLVKSDRIAPHWRMTGASVRTRLPHRTRVPVLFGKAWHEAAGARVPWQFSPRESATTNPTPNPVPWQTHRVRPFARLHGVPGPHRGPPRRELDAPRRTARRVRFGCPGALL